jgi:hypothetical protein
MLGFLPRCPRRIALKILSSQRIEIAIASRRCGPPIQRKKQIGSIWIDDDLLNEPCNIRRLQGFEYENVKHLRIQFSESVP